MKKILNTKADPKICTAAVILKDNKVLLGLRHYGEGFGSWWTTPGGRCDEGETIEGGLRREVAEEVGITDINILGYLCEVISPRKNSTVHYFICDTNEEEKLMEPDKFSEWRWFSKEDIPKNFINEEALEYLHLFFNKHDQ